MACEENNGNTLRESADHLQNSAQVCDLRDTALTQPRSPTVPWGFTYFVRRGDAIKIGHSGNPKQRISDLQICFPEPLEVIAVIPNTIIDEPTAHKKFAHLRLSGEWFQATPDLLDFIKWVKAEADQLPKRKYPTPAMTALERDTKRMQHHLMRLRREAPEEKRHIISLLVGQLKNLPRNSDGMGPLILRTVEAIEA